MSLLTLSEAERLNARGGAVRPRGRAARPGEAGTRHPGRLSGDKTGTVLEQPRAADKLRLALNRNGTATMRKVCTGAGGLGTSSQSFPLRCGARAATTLAARLETAQPPAFVAPLDEAAGG